MLCLLYFSESVEIVKEKMSWFVPWTEMLKNGSVRYILQRYLGQYFEEKLSVEQLTVDLFKGIGSITNIALDVQVSFSFFRVLEAFVSDDLRLRMISFTSAWLLFRPSMNLENNITYQ